MLRYVRNTITSIFLFAGAAHADTLSAVSSQIYPISEKQMSCLEEFARIVIDDTSATPQWMINNRGGNHGTRISIGVQTEKDDLTRRTGYVINLNSQNDIEEVQVEYTQRFDLPATTASVYFAHDFKEKLPTSKTIEYNTPSHIGEAMIGSSRESAMMANSAITACGLNG